MTVVFLDDAVSDGQAQAGTAPDAFGGKERIVDLRHIFRRDADPGVGNFNYQQAVVFSVARGQRDTAVAVGNRIARIQNQIRKDLLQLD